MFESTSMYKRVSEFPGLSQFDENFDEWLHGAIVGSFPSNMLTSVMESEFCIHIYRLVDSGRFDSMSTEEMMSFIEQVAKDYVEYLSICCGRFKVIR